MANIRDLNRKISSLHNMQKVMSAMNMIASTKFKKFSNLQENVSSFNKSVEKMAAIIESLFKESDSPLLHGFKAQSVKRCQVLLFTADRGLCASHNSSAQKALLKLAEIKKNEGCELVVACIGNKGASYCKKNGYEVNKHTEINEKKLDTQKLESIAFSMMSSVLKQEVHEIILIYNEFESTLVQNTKVLTIVPFLNENSAVKQTVNEYAIEPSGEEFLEQSIRVMLLYKIKIALYNSHLSEQAARMTAMGNAVQNSDDLIFRYGKMKNRARQTTITNELIEIVAGKEALKE